MNSKAYKAHPDYPAFAEYMDAPFSELAENDPGRNDARRLCFITDMGVPEELLFFLWQHSRSVATTQAARDVLAERQRQVTVEGFTAQSDDTYDDGTLSSAAVAYASYAADMIHPFSLGDGDRDREGRPPLSWPWARGWWKPVSPRRALVKAAALLLAEIEKLDRKAVKNPT
jgi:hypothetical protein